jgi:D-beta-D-heptose 7-phosphate kinase/D-beta-D-heptose 1-phosphate adenosyltransferase
LVHKLQAAVPSKLSHAREGQPTRAQVLKILEQHQPPVSAKIVSLPELLQRAGELRKEGKQLVLAYGNFEILHPGHVASLEWARQLGDFLVVGVRSDRVIQLIKGGGKTGIPQSERAAMLAALRCVDFVTVWEDPAIQTLVEKLRPDVVVNGIEWPPEQVLGWQIVEQYGGRIVTVPIGVRGGAGQSRYPFRALAIPEKRAGEGEEPAVIRFPRAA